MTQGQSAYTRFKEERFVPVLAQSLRISKADKIARFAYYHVDLNAGSGFNEEVKVAGSPLNFLAAVERNQRRNFYAFFVDRDLSCIRDLIRRPQVEAHADRVRLFHADNAEILPIVSEFVAAREPNPHLAIGSILIDPNGYHKGVPWEALREFCAAHPRFDLFINLNIRSYRMERSHILTDWKQYELRPVSQFPTWFSRPHWMWTDIVQLAGNSWMQFVARTMATDTPGYSQIGFYDSRSERGRFILNKLEAQEPGSQLPFL
jgi:hypothetical protein